MKQKYLFLIIGIIFLSSLVSATTFQEVTLADPLFRINFGEDVNVINSTIYRLKDVDEGEVDSETPLLSQFPIEREYGVKLQTSTGGQYVFVSKENLPRGYYVFSLDVADTVSINNRKIITKAFKINYDEAKIKIIQPKNGVSPTEDFTLIVGVYIEKTRAGLTPLETQVESDCRYLEFDPKYEFYGTPEREKMYPYGRAMDHRIQDFTTIFPIKANQKGKELYFICLDDRTGGRSGIKGWPTQKKFEIRVDTKAPTINLRFDPPKVIDIPVGGGNFQADLIAEANEEVICKYTADAKKNYTDMKPFEDNDENDDESYKKIQKQKLTFPGTDKVKYTYAVECVDKVGLHSKKQSKTIEIDTSAGLTIAVQSPKRYQSEQEATLNFTTNKRAYCSYTEKAGEVVVTSPSNPSTKHSKDLGSLTEGTYKLPIKCTSMTDQETTHQLTFTIDSSAPSGVTVNGSTVSCEEDFEFDPPIKLKAEDEESGISKFMYSVPTLDIENESTSSEISDIDVDKDENVTSGTEYSIEVHAINNAGMKGPKSSFTVKYDPLHPKCAEKEPPSVKITEERMAGEVELYFECVDESGCDESTFMYGLAATKDECVPNSLLYPPFTLPVRTTSYVCYSVFDIVGNEKTGSREIIVGVSGTCDNGIQDTGESDIDCGGICGQTCEGGTACEIDGDCLSSYCENLICKEATCTDTVLNGRESDIDCGGDCPKCELNETCDLNSDCVSGYCEGNMCQVASCMDGAQNGDETDVDCGGSCPECSLGQSCDMNADCSSNNCVFGYCDAPTGEVEDEPTKEEPGFISRLFGFIGRNILFILGVLLILGGVGYLSTGAKPPTSMGPIVSPPPKLKGPSLLEEGRRKEVEDKINVEKERISRKRLEEKERKRDVERSKIFQRFGTSPEKPKVVSKIVPALKPRVAPPIKEKIITKEEWVPLGKLTKTIKEIMAPKPKPPIKPKEESEEFKELEKLEEKGVFEKLPRGNEPEDVFEKKFNEIIGEKKKKKK